jgi:hypothetical protein
MINTIINHSIIIIIIVIIIIIIPILIASQVHIVHKEVPYEVPGTPKIIPVKLPRKVPGIGLDGDHGAMMTMLQCPWGD